METLCRCFAHGPDKTASERAEFAQQLPNVNMLFLGCHVLIMADRSYASRFWVCSRLRTRGDPSPDMQQKMLTQRTAHAQCQFELWLSLMMASADGLISATPDKMRCTIEMLHGAPKALAAALR